MGPSSNPELVRNARAQLRVDRMLSAGAICGVLSLVVGYATAHNSLDSEQWGLDFLRAAVSAQIFLLLIFGGLASLLAVQREKDLNTFDFQRMTRLTSLELAAGKLFGAPIFAYFIALCLMPAAAVGALAGRADFSIVLTGFAIVLLGAISLHAFALVLSLLVDRTTAIANVLILVFVVLSMPIAAAQIFLNVGPLSPFFAVQLVTSRSWTLNTAVRGWRLASPGADVFFGWPVHHASVLPVLYATFTGWCLLALVRNIKRDPAVYEIFSPWQALGFAAYINLLVVGFFQWRQFTPLEAHGVLLGINAGLFLTLGLMLLRNRDRVRRLRQRGAEAAWVTLTWPAPYLLLGTLLAGLVAVAAVELVRNPVDPWNPWIAIFRVAALSAWILRDILYLQWRNLARGRRPLLVGLLYLVVFYACVVVVSASLHLFSSPTESAYVAIFAPAAALGLDPKAWAAAPLVWAGGLCIQIAAAGVFVALQRRTQVELSAGAPASA